MKLKTEGYAKTLEIDSRAVLEGELDRMVDDAIQHAIAKPGQGILVTRKGPGIFTVELSDKVPQGTIEELTDFVTACELKDIDVLVIDVDDERLG